MENKKTDWDAYYNKVSFTAKLTRKITTRLLTKLLKKYGLEANQSIVEFGGANSCFYASFTETFNPSKYIIIDNNTKGLDAFKESYPSSVNSELVCADVLKELPYNVQGDLVFSIGLIEHFDSKQTATAIKSHLKVTKPGGLILLSFPTPTKLYRFARKVLEAIGMWKFYDERPLSFEEVLDALPSSYEILHTTVNNSIILSQGIVLAKRQKVE